MANKTLSKAKAVKNDEFYTNINDIISEIVQHKDYVEQFYGKTVLCNCDDPEWSAFTEFFRKFYGKLRLSRMISTHYNMDGSPSYKLEWSGEKLQGDTINLVASPLKGDGDFRSEECVELLKEADIVVTNPPFSLFRKYISLLEKYHKKYIIIGSKSAITYKEVFPLLKEGKLFIGYNAGHGTMKFATEPNGPATKSVPSYWYTNMDILKRHELMPLVRNYYGNEGRYPRYDNYDAIECGKVDLIPKDYFPCWYKCPHAGECEYARSEAGGVPLCEQNKYDDLPPHGKCSGIIGVPVTYMAKHCQEQFDILGLMSGSRTFIGGNDGRPKFYINGQGVYARILIRRKPNSPSF